MTQVRLDVSEVPSASGINGELQAFHTILKHASVSAPFATLMGISGLAFRNFWHVGKEEDGTFGTWSDSSLEAAAGMAPLFMACQWVGWVYTPYHQNSLDELYRRAKRTIDAGIPGITRGPMGAPVPGLIIGYAEDKTRKLDFLSRNAGSTVTALEIPMVDIPLLEYGHWRNPLFVVEPGEPLAEGVREVLLLEAFGRCAEVRLDQDLDAGRWIGGVRVYERIAADLESEERLREVIPGLDEPDEGGDERVYLLGEYVTELGRARGTAYEFLDTYAEDYPIDSVARLYEIGRAHV